MLPSRTSAAPRAIRGLVMGNSFTNQCLAHLDRWKIGDVTKVGAFRLPKPLDEEVARLHLERIGVKLAKHSKKQADYLGVPVAGPYKPEHYRYQADSNLEPEWRTGNRSLSFSADLNCSSDTWTKSP